MRPSFPAFFICLLIAANAANLVEDGSFEGGAPFATEREGNEAGRWTMYLPKGTDGAFTLDGEGRSGHCALYTKTAEGSENLHLNQVFEVKPATAYEVRAWVKGDGRVRPFFAVSGMNWKHLATAIAPASEAWRQVRLFFDAGTNTRLRLEWWGGASGKPFTGEPGTARLDDVVIEPMVGRVEVAVSVDAKAVLKAGLPPRPIGVSENVFFSSDRHYPQRKVSQVQSLKDLGGRTVRGMEGNIGDFLIWSVPPYEKPAIRSTAWHPGRLYFGSHFHPDGTLQKPMEFDEFLETGMKAGVTEFFYVVGIDAILIAPGTWQRLLPDAEKEILRAAEAQARYARSRGARMWYEIGNEVDLAEKPDKQLPDWEPAAYAELAKRLSAALKRGDPGAKVGVNGGFKENRAWLDLILPRVASDIDFVVAHAYSPTGTYGPDRVNEAIDRLAADPAVKGRWPLCLTETSSYSPGAPVRNDLAESTRNFVRYGINLLLPRVTYMHFWTDHAAEHRADSGKCAFGPDGGLLPMARVLALWNEHLGDRMVKAEVDLPGIPAFATAKADGTVNVFVANVLGLPHRFSVRLDDATIQTVAVHAWSGADASDLDPKWVDRGAIRRQGDAFPVDLPGFGFAMLSYGK